MSCPALMAWLYIGELGASGVLITSRMRSTVSDRSAAVQARTGSAARLMQGRDVDCFELVGREVADEGDAVWLDRYLAGE